MRHAAITIAAVLVLLGILLVGGARAPAQAGGPSASPSPSPTPSAEPTSTPTPAAGATVRHALQHRSRAQRTLRLYRHAAACFLHHPDVSLWQRPDRGAGEDVWVRAGERWEEQHARFVRQGRDLVDRMKHPGGSSNGVRWTPLLRWIRYPESIIPTFVYIIGRESSGRVRAVNPSSGCAGLLQFQPAWYRGQWGYPAFNPFDAEANLRAGLHLWREVGMQPWAL